MSPYEENAQAARQVDNAGGTPCAAIPPPELRNELLVRSSFRRRQKLRHHRSTLPLLARRRAAPANAGCGLGVPAGLCKAYRLGRLAVCSAESGCPLTRAAQGSRESKLLRQRTALHLGRVFSQHTSPSSSWRAESRTGLVALGSAPPPRARCLRPVSVPVSLLMGLFAPRRLSLPSTPDGSLPPLSGC
jgi:hypothetical protein